MGPPERDLPPAFPQWLRDWDPILAEEDDNPLFEAFRRRRLVYPPPLARRLWTRLRLPLLEGTVNVMVLLLAFYTAMFLPAIWIVPVIGLALAAGYATRVFGDGGIPARTLVERIGPVLGTTGAPSQVLYDIALSGASTREMFTAIYLERREESWRREALAVSTVAGAVIAGYSFLSDPFRPAGVALLAGVALMAWKVLEAVTVAAMDRFASDAALRYIHIWRGDSILTSGFAGLGGQLRFEVLSVVPVAMVLSVMVLVVVLVRVAAGGFAGQGVGPTGMELGMNYPLEVLAGLVLAGSAFALHVYNSIERRRALAAFNRRAAEAAEPLREFLLRSFEGDRA